MTFFDWWFLVGTQKSGGNNPGSFPGVFSHGKFQQCTTETLGEKELDSSSYALPEGRTGAPLHLRPESEEGALRAAAAGKTKSKRPTTNSPTGSSSAIGFLAETTRSWRRKP